MVTASFKEGQKTAITTSLQKYDYGEVLRIKGLSLPRYVAVQFAVDGMSEALPSSIGETVEDVTDVLIPNSLLRSNIKPWNYNIMAYVYIVSGSSGKTEYTITIPVKWRPKTGDDQAADDDVAAVIGSAVEKMNTATTKAENAANHATETAEEIKADREKITTNEIKIAGLKSDLGDLITKKINSKIHVIKNGSDTVSNAVYDDNSNVVFTFVRNTGYIGLSMELTDTESILNKKYRCVIRNDNDFYIEITLLLSRSAGNWTPPDYATNIKSFILNAGETASVEIDGSNFSNITGDSTGGLAYAILKIESNNDIGIETKLVYYCVENKSKFENAVHAENAENAQNAENAVHAENAENAGFNRPLTNKVITSITNNPLARWDRTEKEYTIHIEQPDASVVKKHVNHTFAIDIKEMFGKGAKIKIDVHNDNYSGNLSTSWVLNNFYISKSPTTWGINEIKKLTGIDMGNVDSSFKVDLDSLGINSDDYDTIYLLIAAHSYHIQETQYNPPTTITIRPYIFYTDTKVYATDIVGFEPKNYYTKSEVDEKFRFTGNYITCWGDSLTAGGGWNDRLAELAGMTMYNGGTGGENARTIVARQGADVMLVDAITIPATTDPVTIATRTSDIGITTYEGYKVTPLLQGGSHVNPVKIGDVEGILKWTGSNYADMNGIWTFTRSVAGDAVVIDRPTAIRTEFDRNKNAPHLMVIFIGQNGGYTDNDDLIRQHRLMIEHANAKNFIVLGLSSGTASGRKNYEDAMKKEFGRYFISLREYLAHPIYQNGEIVSCYGLADQNITPDPSYSYNGKTTLQEITEGSVPHQILADVVHYTVGTKTVIGNMLYKKCCELGIF